MAELHDVAAAYDHKFAAEGFRNNAYYYQWALDVLAPRPGETLLDIACGLGDLLAYASTQGLACNGIDLSFEAAHITKQRVPGAGIARGVGEHLPYADESFDNITILGSLEHFLNPGDGLIEMRRILKWGGKCLILVPNSYYLPDIVWQVWRSGWGPNHKQIVERFATCQEWRAFIESGGLKVRRIKKFNFQRPRSADDLAWYRANRKRWLGLIAAPFIPFNLSHSFLYLCEKDPATKGRTFDPPYWPVPPRLVDLP